MIQATIDNVTVGTVLVPDGGFTCISEGVPLEVEDDFNGMFVRCTCGKHYIDGQLDDGDKYIGFSIAE